MNKPSIEDQLAIRELLDQFAIGCMRADIPIWGDTWAEEASWKIDMLDEPAVGKKNIVAVYEKILSNIDFVSITSFPEGLSVDGDQAQGKCYSQELIFPKAGGTKILVGCHHDKYIRRDGRWYFLSRVYETLRRSPIGEGS